MKLRWFFVFFFLSGLCSLVFEVVWMRLTMACMGVTTPLISIFLSIFMAGLGLGSWALGKFARRRGPSQSFHPLRWYAATELLIGVAAFVVPRELRWARSWLEGHAAGLPLTSGFYYVVAGALLALILLPWSTCMGATFPFAMAAIRKLGLQHEKSFSFLYLANVMGAVVGALLPAYILVELLGFIATLHTIALLNFLIAASAFSLSMISGRISMTAGDTPATADRGRALPVSANSMLWVLFLTGLVSMAMEVVWIRQYTPFVGTTVYAFALILSFYLTATFLGSQFYRRWSRNHSFEHSAFSWFLLGLASLLPLLMADPRLSTGGLHMRYYVRLAVGLMPFSALVGFLTPMLVDYFSGGDPDRAGRAYAVNILGCIAGPLLSGFLLLPAVGERWSLVLLSLPLFALAMVFGRNFNSLQFRLRILAETAGLAILLLIFTRDFETIFPHRRVQRDYAATAIAANEGMGRTLVVSGQTFTTLTPVTKVMAHLPLAIMDHPAKRALVICFGMGTTHRSILSWGISSTAVELLPSVPHLYAYFHEDGPALLASSNSHLVIDDGRMFMEKTSQQFDLITVDPPPPISAAGVSLLYSREFCELVKKHLAPGGIFQQWIPLGDDTDYSAVAQTVRQSFPYVRAFRGVEGWGLHFLASMSPIPNRTAPELAQRLPAAAGQDFIEWGPGRTPQEQFAFVLSNEMPMPLILSFDPAAPAIVDDRPVNEYTFLRGALSLPLRERLFAAAANWRTDMSRL